MKCMEFILLSCYLVDELTFAKFIEFHAPNWPVIMSFAVNVMTGLTGYQLYLVSLPSPECL